MYGHQVTEGMIGGRAAHVQTIRVRHANKGWGYYNRVIVRFLDDNETHTMGAAAFAKWSAKLDREAAKRGA